MILGMDEAHLEVFLERISAVAIANQAALKCLLNGLPATSDNIILFVGDFVDPAKPEFASLIAAIENAIEEVLSKPPLDRRKN